MLILNNFSVLCIWLEKRVKREERDILLRPAEAEPEPKQKHLHHQNQRVEEREEEEGLHLPAREGDVAAELANKGEVAQIAP